MNDVEKKTIQRILFWGGIVLIIVFAKVIGYI